MKSDLGLEPLKRSLGYLLYDKLKQGTTAKAKHLFQWYVHDNHRKILFLEENSFIVEEEFNKQKEQAVLQPQKKQKDLLKEFKEATTFLRYWYQIRWRLEITFL
ncbi:hypothetical protein Trydic_g15385 [Trypoxylus dichotomus]